MYAVLAAAIISTNHPADQDLKPVDASPVAAEVIDKPLVYRKDI
jgi:hypothetical protein